MNCKFIVPVILPDMAEYCLENYELDPSLMLIVDNTPDSYCRKFEARGFQISYHPHNLGLAASWNRGVKRLEAGELLWIITQSMIFPHGYQVLVDAAQKASRWGVMSYHNWHLMGITKEAFDLLGAFDENYYPAYYEESDWMRRKDVYNATHDGEVFQPTVHIYCGCQGNNITYRRGVVNVAPWDPNFSGKLYYMAKWGGDGGQERFVIPFDGKEPHSVPERTPCIPGVCTP